MDVADVVTKACGLVEHARGQRCGERICRQWLPTRSERDFLAIRRQLSVEPGLEAREPAVDVSLQRGIGVCFPLIELVQQPIQPRPLAPRQRAALFREPGDMDLEVS